jgi:long-chain fatty acid transport protein
MQGSTLPTWLTKGKMMKRSAISKTLLATSAFAVLALASNAASAAGFANRQQSASGMGFAYAGAGTSAWGIGSMFWNPANITNFEGRRSEWNLSLIVPNSAVTTTSASTVTGIPLNLAGIPNVGSGNINQGSVAPASYNSYQVNNWLWIGLANGAPFGNTTKADAGFSGSIYGTSTKIKSTAFTPTIGIKVNEQIAFGFGVTLQQLIGNFKSGDPRVAALNPAFAALRSTELKGDGYGYGFTAGVTLKPFQGTEISLGYRSSINHHLNGETINPAFPGGQFLTRLKINTPESATLGIRQVINDQWTVVGTAQWTNWSRIKSPRITNRVTGGVVAPFGIGYKDEYFVSVGAEYQYNQDWKFRAGIAYEKAPTDDENRGVRVLDANRIIVSAGAGYNFSNKLSVDFSYSHLFIKNGLVNIVAPGNALNPGGNPGYNGAINYSGRSRAHADIVAVSVKYRWDDPSSSAAPLVKKF